MSSVQKPTAAHARAEDLLASLAGVASAHVVLDQDQHITEIHILATPDLHPKQVVRNVESAMSAGLGIQIDRRIVSVAQIRTEARADRPEPASPRSNGQVVEMPRREPDPALYVTEEGQARDDEGDRARPTQHQDRGRLEYVRYQARRDAERCTCEVVLRQEDEEMTGTGAGADTAGGRVQAAARAVLDAIQQARPDLRIELDGAAISSSRGRSFVLVSAYAMVRRNRVSLAGAAPLNRSPEEAAILAALQATNRWSA